MRNEGRRNLLRDGFRLPALSRYTRLSVSEKISVKSRSFRTASSFSERKGEAETEEDHSGVAGLQRKLPALLRRVQTFILMLIFPM